MACEAADKQTRTASRFVFTTSLPPCHAPSTPPPPRTFTHTHAQKCNPWHVNTLTHGEDADPSVQWATVAVEPAKTPLRHLPPCPPPLKQPPPPGPSSITMMGLISLWRSEL